MRVKSDNGEHFVALPTRASSRKIPASARGAPVGWTERYLGLSPGPAHSAPFCPVGGRTLPARADPGKVAAGPY